MDNPRFVDNENISLAHDEDRDNDYDDYNTPNTSIIQGATFTVPDTMQTTSTLWLREKGKKKKKATTIFIIFWDFLMFCQIFLSPQDKWCANITYKHSIYELPHMLPKNLKLRILEN